LTIARALITSAMNELQTGWQHFEHKADIGIRGIGRSLPEAFEQAAIALCAVVTDPALIECREEIDIRCEEDDVALLFVDWINALIYQMATRKMLFCRSSVILKDKRLRAKVCGERVDTARHQPAVEVKGATYTALRVSRNAEGAWIAQCVVDV
jgi:SHS2 domain-containing protein